MYKIASSVILALSCLVVTSYTIATKQLTAQDLPRSTLSEVNPLSLDSFATPISKQRAQVIANANTAKASNAAESDLNSHRHSALQPKTHRQSLLAKRSSHTTPTVNIYTVSSLANVKVRFTNLFPVEKRTIRLNSQTAIADQKVNQLILYSEYENKLHVTSHKTVDSIPSDNAHSVLETVEPNPELTIKQQHIKI